MGLAFEGVSLVLAYQVSNFVNHTQGGLTLKGIILAGGTGSRLYPATRSFSKQLLPVYDKPMIYYPLSVLMLANVREIMIITTPRDEALFRDLLSHLDLMGVSISFRVQAEPRGIADALIVAKDFICNEPVMLVLGDNLFWGQGFSPILQNASNLELGARIFCYPVADPERFGVAEIDSESRVISIEEKPISPKSKYAITGLYALDADCSHIASELTPSSRGELEITGVLQRYLDNGLLEAEVLGRGFAWLDTGTHESLLEAGHFVSAIEKRQGVKIACIEEIALANGWVDAEMIVRLSASYGKGSYGQYLRDLIAS